jgi:hypothetical protein
MSFRMRLWMRCGGVNEQAHGVRQHGQDGA